MVDHSCGADGVTLPVTSYADPAVKGFLVQVPSGPEAGRQVQFGKRQDDQDTHADDAFGGEIDDVSIASNVPFA